MSTSLKSEKAKLICKRIEMQREALEQSICSVENSVEDLKVTSSKIAHNPLSLFLSQKKLSSSTSAVEETVKQRPLVSAGAALFVGWAAGYVLSKRKQEVRNLGGSISNLVSNVSNSSFANSIWTKLKQIGEAALDDVLNIEKRKDDHQSLTHAQEAYPVAAYESYGKASPRTPYHNGSGH